MMDSDDRDLIRGLCDDLVKAQSKRWPQATFEQDHTAVTARLDTSHLLILAKSLQDGIDKAKGWLERNKDADAAAREFAREYAASRRILNRQIMLHLSNGLSEYEPENEDGQHAPPEDIMVQFGLRDDL